MLRLIATPASARRVHALVTTSMSLLAFAALASRTLASTCSVSEAVIDPVSCGAIAATQGGLAITAGGEVLAARTFGLDKMGCDGVTTTIYDGNPGRVRMAPDGSIYLIEIDRNCCGNIGSSHVRRIPAFGGPAETVAGQPYVYGFGGDGGPATAATMQPVDIAIGPDGLLYIAGNARIRRVGANGIITTIAGTGDAYGPLGDGGAATGASLDPYGIDVAPDGSVYVADLSHGNRVRKIAPNGVITTIAGGDGCIYSCDYRFPPCLDDVPATQACLVQPQRVRVSPTGSVYVHDNAYVWRVREITPNGLIRSVAGNGTFASTGNGGPATAASVAVNEMTFGPDGSLYIAECPDYYCGGATIRRIHCPDAARRCESATCGDGVIDRHEECDDQNTDDHDGCSQCRLQAVRSPWKAYAPIVRLHPDEEFQPADPAWFLRCSTLAWAAGGQCSDEPVAGRTSASQLRHHPYMHGMSVGTSGICPMEDPQLSSQCHTRPWDGKACDATIDGFPVEQGFYLDFHESDPKCPREGFEGSKAPAFYEYLPNDSIVYWFFYPYDRADIGQLPDQYHEGDWENVTIKLDPVRNVPLAVAFFAHGDPTIVPWQDVTQIGTHPVVYSAKGTHASYATPGDHDTSAPGFVFHDQTADGGREWSTMRSLKKVLKQGWWWFGGGWGEVAYSRPNPAVPESDYSGPLGPSPYKRGLLSDAEWRLAGTCDP